VLTTFHALASEGCQRSAPLEKSSLKTSGNFGSSAWLAVKNAAVNSRAALQRGMGGSSVVDGFAPRASQVSVHAQGRLFQAICSASGLPNGLELNPARADVFRRGQVPDRICPLGGPGKHVAGLPSDRVLGPVIRDLRGVRLAGAVHQMDLGPCIGFAAAVA